MFKRLLYTAFLLTFSIATIDVSAQQSTVSTGSINLTKPSAGDTSNVETTGKKASKRDAAVTSKTIETDLSEALTVIEQNYADGDKLNYNNLFKSSIDSMLHTLDPHSDYFDAKEFEEFRTSQRSEYFGIGATINDLTTGNGTVLGTYIKATFDGAPAQRAGLRYGDLIVEINGESVKGKRYPYVRDRLRGPRGTIAKLVVQKFDSGKLVPVEIVRDAVSTPSITEAYMVRPDVGYIAMSGGFNQTTFDEFQLEMTKLKAAGMKKLMLDLRYNPGGLVSQAFLVANTFLKSGQVIITQRGRGKGLDRRYRADNPSPDETPLIVLVNGNSASASEILSGALQDHDRALIVGETTFGKGLITNPFQLEYGSMVLLTIAKFETPSGRLIQRDYSDGKLYDYQTHGGTLDEADKPPKPKTDKKQTDSGRIVYGGGGISPDIEIKQRTLTPKDVEEQRTLIDPLYMFSLELAYGKVKGFEKYRINSDIIYNHDLSKNEFVVTPELIKAFNGFANREYKINATVTADQTEFITRVLRSELVTAQYGTTTSLQVFNDYDTQLLEALKLFPQAEALELSAGAISTKSK
ncbi:MAG: S41 family peptidase [Pyrinomonadaceae bacterium]